MKIKILYLLTRVNIGGPALHVSQIVQNLDPDRFDIRVACGDIDPSEGDMSYAFRDHEFELIRVPGLVRPIRPHLDFLAFLRVLSLLFRIKPDILDTHMAKAGFVGRGAAIVYNLLQRLTFQKHRIRKVHTFHGHTFHSYFGALRTTVFLFLERLLARTTDRILVLSETQKTELLKEYRIGREQTYHRINLGLDYTYMEKENQEVSTHFRGFAKKLKIGFIGRLVPVKNPLFLVSLLNSLDKSIRESLHFFLAGGGSMADSLKNQLNSAGHSGTVTFLPWISELGTLYENLDAVFLFSRNEGTPIVILEALYSGITVAATPVGGVIDLLADQPGIKLREGQFLKTERGYLAGVDDTSAWGSLTEELVNLFKKGDLSQRPELRKFVLDNYSIRTLIDNLTKLYNGLTS